YLAEAGIGVGITRTAVNLSSEGKHGVTSGRSAFSEALGMYPKPHRDKRRLAALGIEGRATAAWSRIAEGKDVFRARRRFTRMNPAAEKQLKGGRAYLKTP
ncbi:MAG: hypothetical protein C4321_11180, partial [Chloroflexota bacterium]